MSPDLDEALCRDFPLLYRARNDDDAYTCMHRGFEVGDGWEPIIRRLSEKLERMISALPEDERPRYRAEQVKEKFGALRFYMTAETEEMFREIAWAETESARTCEDCGAPGKTGGSGWLRTTCEAHLVSRLGK